MPAARLAALCLTTAAALAGVFAATQEDAATPAELRFVTAYSAPVLRDVVSAELSADGRHVYAASYNAKTVAAFARDAGTGKLAFLQAVGDADRFDGVTALRLAPAGDRAAAAAFRSDAVTLLSRDPNDGTLTVLDSVADGQTVPGGEADGLDFAVELIWSPDSRHVHVLAAGDAAISTFRIVGFDRNELELVQTQRGEDGCFLGARGAAFSPDGGTLYVASERAGTLAVLTAEADGGMISLRQVFSATDAAVPVPALAGAMGVAVSPDGRFVYTSSGRFRGSDAVAAFRVKDDGTLEPIQSLLNGDGLTGFERGNEITVTPSGEQVIAIASGSDAVVLFDRNPETGLLTQRQTVTHGPKTGPLKGVSGIGVSPDGRFVYAAAEDSDALTVYELAPARDAAE